MPDESPSSPDVTVRLHRIVDELEEQRAAFSDYDGVSMPLFVDHIRQLREWIGSHECGIAYETIVVDLESRSCVLSSTAACALLDVGLLFGYKTDRPEDAPFDRRASAA